MTQSDSVLAPPEEGEQPFISVDPHIQDYLNKVQDANPVLSLLMTMGVEADEAQRKSLAEALNKKETLNLSQLDLPTLALYNLFIALRSNTTIKNLNLSDNNIGTFSFLLRELNLLLVHNQVLLYLNLNRTQIGNFGVQRLEKGLAQNQGLKLIQLKDNGIAQSGFNALMRVIGKCENRILCRDFLQIECIQIERAQALLTSAFDLNLKHYIEKQADNIQKAREVIEGRYENLDFDRQYKICVQPGYMPTRKIGRVR